MPFFRKLAIFKGLSENRLGDGDSPILLRGLRKIGTVPGGFRIGCKAYFEINLARHPISHKLLLMNPRPDFPPAA